MHSYQPSRGRIFFQVLCAFGMSASLAVAWMQTGAIALLAGASIAALFGLVHFFDLFRRSPAVEAEPQRIDFDTHLEMQPVQVPEMPVEPQVAVVPQPVMDIVGIEDEPVVEAVPFEPAPPPAKASRNAKAPRKGGSRRKAAPKTDDVATLPLADEAEGELPSPLDAELPDEMPEPPEVPLHPPVTPLFEPEPFGRQPHRATFGRKVV